MSRESKDTEVVSSEVIISIFIRDDIKKFSTYLGLVELVPSGSLGDTNILTLGLAVTNYSKSMVWEAKTSTFKTNHKIELKNMILS